MRLGLVVLNSRLWVPNDDDDDNVFLRLPCHETFGPPVRHLVVDFGSRY